MTAIDSRQPESITSTGPRSSGTTGDLVSALLAESRELTAVERFAKAHDAGDTPAQAKHYQDLIPLSAPSAGEQYAFEVDLDACSGCKACVSACHHMNGLEPEETWRAVGQLYGQNGLPIVQHVTTACHHCVDPGCLNGCPTNAYEKDPETGIVRHLDDQCFGCQYCTMACPYEVPQYSPSKGIVRKCDMCHGRLAEGEAPACVQACPNQAIRISLVNVAETVRRTTAGSFLPSSPPSELTKPTTLYRHARPLPQNLRAADADHAIPQHAHLPLVFMLVLTQLSVGAVAFGSIVRWLGGGIGAEAAIVLGILAGLMGLGLAPLHLGRPHLAFRSILGWRHSWLSREALVFGVFAPLGIGAALFALAPRVEHLLPGFVTQWFPLVFSPLVRPAAEVGAVLAGAAGVYCSARIYIFTGREFWLGRRTHLKFAGAGVVLGLALTLATLAVSEAITAEPQMLSLLIIGVIFTALGKLAFEAAALREPPTDDSTLHLSAKLLRHDLASLTKARFGLGLVGGAVLPLAVAVAGIAGWLAATLAVLSFLCLLSGELLERALYFSAVVPLRMPGGVKT